MSKDDDTPQTTPLAPWGSHERSLSPHIYPVSPDEQAASAAYQEGKDAPAKARAAEIEAQIRAGGAGRSKDRGWWD